MQPDSTTPEAVSTIGILLFEGVEELDFVGPWEVLAMAASRFKGRRVVSIAQQAGPLTCAKRLRVLPDMTLESAPPLEVLVVPGGRGIRHELGNSVLLDWIAAAAAPCRFVTSVCTGSALLVAAGPARGKRVATHQSYAEELAQRGECQVERELRFVRDGKLVTSGGISAGIDMALWLVGQLWHRQAALEVRRQMEYYPAPPYEFDV
jgi:transcriptional regulator GlxA family with amidase domain